MSDTEGFEKAREKIEKIVDDLKAANSVSLQDKLVGIVQSCFKTADEQDGSGSRATQYERHAIGYVLMVLIPVGAIGLGFWLTAIDGLKTPFGGNQPEVLRVLMAYLAFVVALSSYLATVIREQGKRITRGDSGRPERSPMTRTEAMAYRDIFWLSIAEICLVFAGVFALVRLAFGSEIETWVTELLFIKQKFCFDTFLLSYLWVILVGLIVLHARVWFFRSKPASNFFMEKIRSK